MGPRAPKGKILILEFRVSFYQLTFWKTKFDVLIVLRNKKLIFRYKCCSLPNGPHTTKIFFSSYPSASCVHEYPWELKFHENLSLGPAAMLYRESLCKKTSMLTTFSFKFGLIRQELFWIICKINAWGGANDKRYPSKATRS